MKKAKHIKFFIFLFVYCNFNFGCGVKGKPLPPLEEVYLSSGNIDSDRQDNQNSKKKKVNLQDKLQDKLSDKQNSTEER